MNSTRFRLAYVISGLACLALVLADLRADSPPVKKTTAESKAKPAIRIEAGAQEAGKTEVPVTHEQVAAVTVRGKEGNITLQTLCVNAKGEVLALVAPPRPYGAPVKNAFSEVHVLSPEGKELKDWKVDFHANSINTGADGNVYVAGDGKVAKFDAAGKALGQVELPHIAKILKDKEGIQKKAEEQLKSQKESFANTIKTYEDMIKKLEVKKAEDRTKLDERQLEQYKQIFKSFDETKKYYDKMKIEDIVNQITSRLRVINGIAASDKDLFIVCGESQGYGFAVWRMGLDFSEAKQILSNVIGCCGQMDVQVSGTDILVAENTKHRFAKYNRDGKALGAWGKRGKETEAECFGGCCNPMNVRCCSTGDVLTAESEGIIKRFSAKGDSLGIVATSKLTGGCKNVSVASSPDGERIYLCGQPNSQVVIFALKTGKSEKKSD
jgi:hypothetical protein